MGLGIAGLGMAVMHDGNHGSYSSSKRVNFFMAHVLNIMGGSTYNWKLQHNVLHHTYTNIDNMDEDIAPKPAIRLCPHSRVTRWNRYQWIHAFFIYGLTTLFWVTAKDFLQYVRYKKNKVSAASVKEHRLILIKMILLKILYFLTFLVLPILVTDIPIIQIITGFFVMHFIAGLSLSVVFQLAHSLEGTAHPLPNNKGVIENDWAIHQMNTTMNFSGRNKVLSWLIGGLNYQVEHHLFPRISHVHYPAISSIVKTTASEFNVPYLEYASFGDALRAHIRYLRRLGRLPSLEESIG
jgi:linoleoyl-CoA desaturase